MKKLNWKKIIKKEGTMCGYCPNVIFKKNEVGGIIHFIDEKPACVRCRVLKSNKLVKSNKEIEKKLQADADERVREFAMKQQIATGTGRLQTNK